MDRSHLVTPRIREPKENNPYEWAFVTSFSSQYWWINGES